MRLQSWRLRNSIFAAVKKYDELKPKFKDVEVVTLTGESKLGFESDRKINAQLDSVMEKFKADAIVFVTDGAEDDQIMPILHSRAPVISKQTVIIKQAREVESTYYTIKEVLKDPAIARIVFLVPGIIVLLWGFLFLANAERFFYQAMSLVVGIYLILKGSGLEDIIASNARNVFSSFSLQRVSFPFYLLSVFAIVLGGYSLYMTLSSTTFASANEQILYALNQAIGFIVFAAMGFIIGKAIDSVQLKKAVYLKNYFLYASAILILSYLLDSGLKVIEGKPYADFTWLFGNVLVCFVGAWIAYKLSGWIDISKRATKLLVGLPVYSKDGRLIGKVEDVDGKGKTVKYKEYRSNEVLNLKEGSFALKKGRVFVYS